MSDGPEKTYNPNVWGFATGVFALLVLAVTHVTIGFPSMLVHVFILPVVIGLVVRWQIKLKYTNTYRDD